MRTSAFPRDPDELTDLAADLEGFTVEAVADCLTPRGIAALDREDAVPAQLQLATVPADVDPGIAQLTRLFLLGERLTAPELALALPTSAGPAREWGLIARDAGRPHDTGGTHAQVDLRPTQIGEEDLLLAADLGEITTGRALPPDHVLGLGGASATLADLTIRRPVARALDVGTGSGIQALGLTGHADHIVATDLSPRALDYAAFNLALNEAVRRVRAGVVGGTAPGDSPFSRVELREGSMLDPAPETFDLIVSNPPFVISPRAGGLDTYTYRDGGQIGDALVAGLIADLPTRLAPGGVAQILANWEIHDGQDWHERVGAWARATGLDAWIIQREYLDAAHYVHTWLRDGGLTPERDPAAYRAAYADWLGDFDRRGVAGVGFGYVTLRKRAGAGDLAEAWVRLEEITGTIAPALGETIARTLTAVEDLAHAPDADLLTWHVAVAADITEERYYHPGEADPSIILLRQGGGLARTVRVGTVEAGVVGACDGELSLGDICRAIASLIDADPAEVIAEVLPTMRGLITDGIAVRERR